MNRPAVVSIMHHRYWRFIGIALVGLWVILLAAQTVRIGVATPPSFDGSMNLEVARSLSQGEGYRRLYAERQPFPHEIQTNAPYILPAAAVFHVLGVGIPQSEIVNIAYLLALMLLAGIASYRSGGVYFGILGAAVVLVTPQLLPFGLEGYGEIPALTWFLAAVVLYFSTKETGFWRGAVCGMFLAFTLLTKTVMLLCIGVFASFAVLQRLFYRDAPPRRSLYSTAGMVVGVLTPVFAFEKWKEISLGGHRAWQDWWHYEGHAILFQAGVQHPPLSPASNPLDKILLHLDILARACQVPTWVTAAWVILVIAAAFVAVLLAAREKKLMAVAAILCVGAFYFIWWLAITPDAKAWPRRILDGIICANVGVVMLVGYLARQESAGSAISRTVALLVLSVVPTILLAKGTFNIFSQVPPDNSRLLQVVEQVKGLPSDAYLFGIGWNSSPLISVLSGRHFADFSDIPKSELDPKRPMYLVRSRGLPSTQEIDGTFSIYGLRVDAPARGTGSSDSQEGGDTQITPADTLVYKLPELRIVPIRLDKGPVRSEIQYTDDYPYLKGPYPPERGNGSWMRTDNVIVLQPTPSAIFYLAGYAPAQKHYEYSSPLEVLITFDGCSIPPLPVPKGIFNLKVDALEYCKLDIHKPWSVRIQLNNVVKSGLTTDEREMSLLFKSVGFH